MKKTLITLLALGGLAMGTTSDSLLSDSKDFQFSSTIDKLTEGTSGGSYRGFQFCLSDALEADRLTLGSEIEEIPSVVSLDSFSFQVRGSASHNGLWAAVLDADNTIIGVSTSSASASGLQMLTFNFSDVQLSTTETYKIVATASQLTTNSILSNSDGSLRTFAVALTQTGDSTKAANLGVLNSSNIDTLASTAYMPFVRIIVSIPEPATATLSLLALAGLAARRRRH